MRRHIRDLAPAVVNAPTAGRGHSMKSRILLLLAATAGFSLLIACGGKKEDVDGAPPPAKVEHGPMLETAI